MFGCVADIGWITGHSYTVYGPLANGGTTVLFESTPIYPDPGMNSCPPKIKKKPPSIWNNGIFLEFDIIGSVKVLILPFQVSQELSVPASIYEYLFTAEHLI